MTSAMDGAPVVGIFDADTHLYEADDCFTRYLPAEFRDRASECGSSPVPAHGGSVSAS